MALAIFQIGSLPVYFNLKETNDDPVRVQGDRQWENAVVEFLGAGGSYSMSDPFRPLSNSQQISLSGTFVCEDGQSAEEIYRLLLSMGGVVQIPIIAFRYEECEHGNICCSECNTALKWIINYGIITKVGQSHDVVSSQRPWSAEIIPIDLQMIVGTKWKSLNPWEWEYRRGGPILNPLDTDLINEVSNNLFFIPERYNDLVRTGYFFKWGVSLSKYNPTYWGVRYSEGRYGGYGSDFVDFGEYLFSSDPRIWSAPPNSVYAFTNFSDQSGSINIEITKGYDYGYNLSDTETSTLSIAQLNTDMLAAGYSGLMPSDIVITGFAQPFPGFVIRNNEILDNLRPRWTYSGSYPGETSIGVNRILFTGSNIFVKVAFLHDFGMY